MKFSKAFNQKSAYIWMVYLRAWSIYLHVILIPPRAKSLVIPCELSNILTFCRYIVAFTMRCLFFGIILSGNGLSITVYVPASASNPACLHPFIYKHLLQVIDHSGCEASYISFAQSEFPIQLVSSFNRLWIRPLTLSNR